MNVSHDSQPPSLSFPVQTAIISVTLVSFVINTVFFIVGCKSLKKTLHHLLILMLCFSEAVLCSSACITTLSQVSEIMKENTVLCLIEVFLIYFGILSNYLTLFLLCLQRYLLLRTTSFGSRLQRLENFRYQIVIGTLLAAILFQLADSLLIPWEENINSCDITLYGKHSFLFVAINIVPVSICMILIVIFYLHSCCIIWKRFLKPTVHPKVGKDINTKQPEHQSADVFVNFIKTKDEIYFTNIESIRNTSENSSLASTNRNHHSDDGIEIIKTPRVSVGEISFGIETPSQINEVTDGSSQVGENKDNTGKQEKKGGLKWERKVFLTCVILATETLTLTMPTIIGLWYVVISGTHISFETKLIISIPYGFSSLSNPFIFAWRIPEIRQGFKRIFKCLQNTQGT